MTENIATKMIYVCAKCGTRLELVMPYHFPDGTRFPWTMEEMEHPDCPLQNAEDSGFPGEHVMNWKSSERVKE